MKSWRKSIEFHMYVCAGWSSTHDMWSFLSFFFWKSYIFWNAKHPGWTTLTTLTTQSTRTDLPTWPIRPPKYSEHSDHPTTFTIPTPDHLDHTQKRTSETTIKKLSKTTIFKLVGKKCPERQFAKYAICWSRNMIIFETVKCKIWSRMITCKEVVRHNIKVVQKENLQTKICAQNLQNFTEMIRNNNLQIRFTEPPYEKKFQSNRLQKPFPHRQFANKKKL